MLLKRREEIYDDGVTWRADSEIRVTFNTLKGDKSKDSSSQWIEFLLQGMFIQAIHRSFFENLGAIISILMVSLSFM